VAIAADWYISRYLAVQAGFVVSLTLACSHRHVRSVPSIVVDHSTFLPDTNPDFHHSLLKE
jgi:hypothetical protein